MSTMGGGQPILTDGKKNIKIKPSFQPVFQSIGSSDWNTEQSNNNQKVATSKSPVYRNLIFYDTIFLIVSPIKSINI